MRPIAGLAIICLAVACGEPRPTTIPDIAHEPVAATFEVQLDRAAARAPRSTLEPIASPIAISGGTDALALTATVKKMSQRAGVLWVELYFENRSATALSSVTVDVAGLESSELYDLTQDPYAQPTEKRVLDLGRIAKHGIGRLAIGLPDDASPLSFRLTVHGETTLRAATVSASVAITPDGSQAWIPVPDADLVAVVDTRSDERIAQIPVAGRPVGIAITPDGSHALVACSAANAVVVVAIPSRSVVQTFTEADGIGREPRHVVISPDGGRAFVSAYVGDTVTALVRNADRFRVERTVDVGRRPTALSVVPDSSTVLVAHFLPRGPVLANHGWISVLGTDPLEVIKEVEVEDAFNLDKANCFAATIPVRPERVTAEAVSTQLAGVFLNPAGTEGWVPGARIAPAAIVERGPNADPQLAATTQPRGGEISAPSNFIFDTRAPQATDRLLSPGAIERPGLQDYIACERFQLEIEFEDRELLPNGEQVNRFAAFSTYVNGLTATGTSHFIGFTLGGRRALILSYNSDEIALHDATTHSPAAQRHFLLAGSNPTGLAVTPDGTKAYVAYDNSLFVSVLDLSSYADVSALPGPSIVPYDYRDVRLLPIAPNGVSQYDMVRNVSAVPDRPTLRELSQVRLVDADPLDPVRRRGRILFHSANPAKYPTLSKSSLGACGSCHPDGGNDGSMWVTMEGERRTMTLRGGVGGRGWLHASATHADANEFVKTVVAERLGGSLSDEDLGALVDYVSHGIPRLQGPRVDPAQVAAGQASFARNCALCHDGPHHTSGTFVMENSKGSIDGLFDVGTATSDAHVALGTYFESILPEKDAQLLRGVRGDRTLGPDDPIQKLLDFRPRPFRPRGAFKAPSLDNVWDNVLFFHDGRFDSLEQAVHFMVEASAPSLTPADEADLVAYLKTL